MFPDTSDPAKGDHGVGEPVMPAHRVSRDLTVTNETGEVLDARIRDAPDLTALPLGADARYLSCDRV